MKRLGLFLILIFSYSAYCQDYTPEICVPLNTSQENLTRLIQTIDALKKESSFSDSPYRISIINRKNRSSENDNYEACISKKIGYYDPKKNEEFNLPKVRDVLSKLNLLDKISLDDKILNRNLFFKEF